jgi:thioredoxin-like negative regulator of GroEL
MNFLTTVQPIEAPWLSNKGHVLMNNVIEIPGAQFEREMQTATQPVLVHFYTSSSGQCRILAQSLETLASELAGEVSIRKANLDDHPELARRYSITDVPTLILFDNGAPIAAFGGSISPRELKAHLQGLLADYAPPRGSGNPPVEGPCQ